MSIHQLHPSTRPPLSVVRSDVTILELSTSERELLKTTILHAIAGLASEHERLSAVVAEKSECSEGHFHALDFLHQRLEEQAIDLRSILLRMA